MTLRRVLVRAVLLLVSTLGSVAMISGCSASGQSSDAASDGPATNATNCHAALACSGTASCAFDCEGNTGNQAGSGGFPRIACSCTSGSFACNIMYEGIGGSPPSACPASLVGSCSSCSLCQAGTDGGNALCFCTKEGQWVCT
jgi:hypothetical protein